MQKRCIICTSSRLPACRAGWYCDSSLVHSFARARRLLSRYEIFHLRYSLFKRVYSHRVSKAVEYMICDALLAADPVLKISDAIWDPKRYVRLTDCILREIENSTDPKLERSRQIIGNIRRRRLYRCVHESLFDPDVAKRIGEVTAADIAAQASAEAKLTADDLIVHNLKINYAMRDKNPVDNVSFFQDWNDTESRKIPRNKVSSLIPEQFEERYLRVFLRDDTPEKIVSYRLHLTDLL